MARKKKAGAKQGKRREEQDVMGEQQQEEEVEMEADAGFGDAEREEEEQGGGVWKGIGLPLELLRAGGGQAGGLVLSLEECTDYVVPAARGARKRKARGSGEETASGAAGQSDDDVTASSGSGATPASADSAATEAENGGQPAPKRKRQRKGSKARKRERRAAKEAVRAKQGKMVSTSTGDGGAAAGDATAAAAEVADQAGDAVAVSQTVSAEWMDPITWGQGSECTILPTCLVRALVDKLHFSTPTPIQAQSIPHITRSGKNEVPPDVFGTAITGSGKTLAYGLPILAEWVRQLAESSSPAPSGNDDTPLDLLAIILTPTRELAMQVVEHLRLVADAVAEQNPVVRRKGAGKSVVEAVVGGMSEQRQERVLLQRQPRIVVGTPGRLWDMISRKMGVLADLSRLRFLVLDEADRMVERGHFAELKQLFRHVQDQELEARAIIQRGGRIKKRDPREMHWSEFEINFNDEEKRFGGGESDSDGDSDGDGDDDDTKSWEEEEEGKGDKEGDSHGKRGRTHKKGKDPTGGRKGGEALEVDPHDMRPLVHRQTLMFSATVQEVLLSMMRRAGAQGEPLLVDATGSDTSASAAGPSAGAAQEEARPAQSKDGRKYTLPTKLALCTIFSQQEDKDVQLYLLLLRYAQQGRSLIFVNSIRTARHVGRLLQVLGLPARPLHAKMQQRQRLKAMDFFRGNKAAILVATDVAARGLDIPLVEHVIHYDIPQSMEVFVHRSGRTARAKREGVSLSIVTPSQTEAHESIVETLQQSQQQHRFVGVGNNASHLPHARQRLQAARKLAKLEDAHALRAKESSWVRKTAEEAGLNAEDALSSDSGDETSDGEGGRRRGADRERGDRKLVAARNELARLLAQPLFEDRRKIVNIARDVLGAKAAEARTLRDLIADAEEARQRTSLVKPQQQQQQPQGRRRRKHR